MAVFVLIPPGTYSAGTRSFGPRAVPQGTVSAKFEIDISQQLDPQQVWNIQIQYSTDDGQSWRELFGAGRVGGPDDNQKHPGTSFLAMVLPDDGLTTRQVKGTISLTGPDLTTNGVTLTTTIVP